MDSEVLEGMHFLLLTRHADMTLVDAQTLVGPLGLGMTPFVLSQLDVDSVVGGVFVLTGEVDPSRDAVFVLAVG